MSQGTGSSPLEVRRELRLHRTRFMASTPISTSTEWAKRLKLELWVNHWVFTEVMGFSFHLDGSPYLRLPQTAVDPLTGRILELTGESQ
jgi:hypothetical protein